MLKVKNTFIDVRPSCVDDDGDVESIFASSIRKRQISEPALAMQRQISAHQSRQPSDPSGMLLLAPVRVQEEDKDFDELDEREEPETEIEPAWIQGRQDTFENSPLHRQVTEQNWPTWGLASPFSFSSPAASSSENAYMGLAGDPVNTWLFGYGGPQSAAPAVLSSLAGKDVLRVSDFTRQQAVVAEAVASLATGNMWGCGGALGPGLGSRSLAVAAQQAAHRGIVTSGPADMEPGGGLTEPPADWADTTTVMMRNLPNKYNQQMLLEELNTSGFLGTYDFIYLPIDPETNANRGYAFLNFTDTNFAWMLKLTYEGRKMGRFNSDKVVSVAPAALQGFEANYAHYSSARVNRGDPATRPLFLRESCIPLSKGDGGRRRGGRRSQGSLIDLAARQQQRQQGVVGGMISPAGASYIGLQGPVSPGALDGTARNLGGDASASSAKPKPRGPPKPVAGSSQVPMRPRFCPFCGGEAEPEFRFCQFCGAALNFPGEAPQ